MVFGDASLPMDLRALSALPRLVKEGSRIRPPSTVEFEASSHIRHVAASSSDRVVYGGRHASQVTLDDTQANLGSEAWLRHELIAPSHLTPSSTHTKP
eukprot:6880706-Prymnesium_polylepis.2